MQVLDPTRTSWHITFGTYGARLHGDERPTVDREHNEFGTPFLAPDSERMTISRARMRHPPIELSPEQCFFVQESLPSICDRGGWTLRIAAAAPNHVHVLVDILPDIHGERVRRLMKRWSSQELSQRWPLAKDAVWWAEQGSNKAIHDLAYLNNAYQYILRQRAK